MRSACSACRASPRISGCSISASRRPARRWWSPPPPDAEFIQTLMRSVLIKRLTLRGFIFSDDYEHRLGEFMTALGGWVRDGRIKYREDAVCGLERAPDAFLGLLEGRNFGKLVV